MNHMRSSTKFIARMYPPAFCIGCVFILLTGCAAVPARAGGWNAEAEAYDLSTDRYSLNIQGDGFRFGFTMHGIDGELQREVAPHNAVGMQLGDDNSPVKAILDVARDDDGNDVLRVEAEDGQRADVTAIAQGNSGQFRVVAAMAGVLVTMLMYDKGHS